MKNKYDIIWLQSIDSTNNEARRRISALDNLSVLSAFCQTSGRGQRGNSWSANAGENLTFSIVLKYESESFKGIKAIDQFAISEIAALAVIDFLAAHDIDAKIKWPNDIYVGKRKICGILVENTLRGEFISSSIIGIGLNINQRNFNVNGAVPTSMILENGALKSYDINSCLDEFMDIFCGHIERFISVPGDYMDLREIYLSKLWRFGEMHEYIRTADGTEFCGMIRGLSEVGHLLIENNEGELMEFAFKEISYVI